MVILVRNEGPRLEMRMAHAVILVLEHAVVAGRAVVSAGGVAAPTLTHVLHVALLLFALASDLKSVRAGPALLLLLWIQVPCDGEELPMSMHGMLEVRQHGAARPALPRS